MYLITKNEVSVNCFKTFIPNRHKDRNAHTRQNVLAKQEIIDILIAGLTFGRTGTGPSNISQETFGGGYS